MRTPFITLCALALLACGDSTGGDAGTPDADTTDVIAPADTLSQDSGPADVADAALDTAPADTRPWRNRVLGGMSMGAASAIIALKHPETFDVVGALGGYADFGYMVAMMSRLTVAGFCPLSQLEGRGDALDDWDADPPVVCGPAQALYANEFPQHYNEFHYDTDGMDMDRQFYGEVFQNFSMAHGNLLTASHPDSPYLPAGVDKAWYDATAPAARCATPPAIPTALSFNAEYNPQGAHPVIPFCDQRPAPDSDAPARFDPALPSNDPVDVALAVDLNGNGRRDLGEPLFINQQERFQDVGTDGCANDSEDGAGGCLGAPDPGFVAGSDPNGDDFHWWDRPDGLQGNDRYDAGEPYADLGLDGVDAAVSGVTDTGEGNGVHDTIESFDHVAAHDARVLLADLPDAQLAHMDFWFDGGIRDALHASVSARSLAGTLKLRGEDIRTYTDFTDRPGAMFPQLTRGGLTAVLLDQELSAQVQGRHVYVEYGDPDADADAIAAGDGKHVGRIETAINRLATFLVAALWRLPDPDLTPGQRQPSPLTQDRHFYSEGLQARRGYTVALPPGYDKPDNASLRYPTLYFLHGLGQTAKDLAPAALLTSAFMEQARLPKAILIFPDGACCRVDRQTGTRYCACGRSQDGERTCVDPKCDGVMESCGEVTLPSNQLVEECHRGSLYANLLTNQWGEPRDDLGYEDSVIDLVRHIDATFRTRSPAP